ncbi:transposase domain-containing protein, partial [Jingyaoa shaoxingensis]
AIVYTIVEMAKANDLNTYKYLTYLLSQRPNDKMSDEQLEQLAPWSETAKMNCQN